MFYFNHDPALIVEGQRQIAHAIGSYVSSLFARLGRRLGVHNRG